MRVNILLVSHRTGSDVTCKFIHTECVDMVTLSLCYVSFVFGAKAPSGPGPPHSRGFLITHNDVPQSVGLLWTSDQLVAENST